MKLAEFFELHSEAPVVKAFQPLRHHLNRHVDFLPFGEYSPWTIRLGKGGPNPAGGMYESNEQSLYRHCMEVAAFGIWLFYHTWKSGQLSFSRDEDLVSALKTMFAIAFAHDADKLKEGKSHSPLLEEVRFVYEMLGMNEWSGLSVDKMHAAVSRVENRGTGQALFGTALLDPLTEKLAELVHQSDNLLSLVARKGGDPKCFVEIYNANSKRLHDLYKIPDQRLRHIRFRHYPVVLHHLYIFLSRILYKHETYPILLVRQGEWLDVAFSETIDTELLATWIDGFESVISDWRPSIKVVPTTGRVTLFNIHGSQEVLSAVKKDERQVEMVLLRVVSQDWDVVAPLVSFWVQGYGAPFGSAPKKGALCPVFSKVSSDAEIPCNHPFWNAAAIAAILNDENMERLLSLENGIVKTGLEQKGIEPKKLSALSLRTAAALQASLVIENEDRFLAWLDEIQGTWPERTDEDPGVRIIVDALKSQIGIAGKNEKDSFIPYEESALDEGGNCLLCGMPTSQVLETGSMNLAGIKASSFSNRIGHRKSLWSERGGNFICPACVRIQGLLLETDSGQRNTPMLVSTPVRHLLDTQTDNVGKKLFRSFDVLSKERKKTVFPWESDTRFDDPLLFEERQVSLDEVIAQMYRFALYVALSGEPVHAFIASQRKCSSSFLYEGTPELIKELLDDITNEEGGIGRKEIPRLIRRLEIFKDLLRQHGMIGIQSIPTFGWWAVAYVFVRFFRNEESKGGRFPLDKLEIVRKEYPMNEYDAYLKTLIESAVRIYQPRYDASSAEWILMLRSALETYQKHYSFGAEAIRDAIAQRLRGDLTRRYKDLYQKGLDENLSAFANAAISIFEKGQKYDLESGFIRFLLAAYEGGFRRAVTEYWNNKKETSTESVSI